MSESFSLYPFLGKVILITGGASGIGLATVRVLYDRGATLAIADINAQGLAEAERLLKQAPAREGQRVSTKVVNVANEAEVFAWVDGVKAEFGRADHAANIAGVVRNPGPLEERTSQEFDFEVDVNFRGVYNCMRAQLKHFSAGSSIVNMSSGAGLQPIPGLNIYAAAKSAVNGLTSAGAREYGAKGIRVNAIAPGVILTPSVLSTPESAKYLQPTVDGTPLGRAGQPAEIAKAVAFLLSDEASYISGVILRCDGGFLTMTH